MVLRTKDVTGEWDALLMHSLVVVNFVPRWESGGVGPGFHSETDPAKDGDLGVIRVPESTQE